MSQADRDGMERERAADEVPGQQRFSAFLRRCRRDRKLSLRQVERLSESFPERISNSYLAYCETGRLVPSLGKLITLSKVLGIPLQSFTERLEIDRETAGVIDPPGTPDGSTAAGAASAAGAIARLRADGIREAEAGELRRAFVLFEKGLGLARSARGPGGRDDDARADCMMDMAIVLKRMSRHYTARDLLEEVISLRGLDAARMDRALILLADVLREMGRLPIAAMIGREALLRAGQAGDRAKEAHAACLVGNALYDMGNVEEAIPCYEKAVRFFRDTKDLPSLVCNMGNLANCLVRDPRGGRFAEGMRLLQEAESIARREGFNRQVADMLGYAGQAWALQNNSARAEKHFFQSNQIARAADYLDILFSNTWHLRELALRQKRASEAADHLRTLRYLRSRVDGTNAEIAAFDRMGRPDRESGPGEEATA